MEIASALTPHVSFLPPLDELSFDLSLEGTMIGQTFGPQALANMETARRTLEANTWEYDIKNPRSSYRRSQIFILQSIANDIIMQFRTFTAKPPEDRSIQGKALWKIAKNGNFSLYLSIATEKIRSQNDHKPLENRFLYDFGISWMRIRIAAVRAIEKLSIAEPGITI